MVVPRLGKHLTDEEPLTWRFVQEPSVRWLAWPPAGTADTP
jgi:hypothetical protein